VAPGHDDVAVPYGGAYEPTDPSPPGPAGLGLCLIPSRRRIGTGYQEPGSGRGPSALLISDQVQPGPWMSPDRGLGRRRHACGPAPTTRVPRHAIGRCRPGWRMPGDHLATVHDTWRSSLLERTESSRAVLIPRTDTESCARLRAMTRRVIGAGSGGAFVPPISHGSLWTRAFG
jgi:hypothetical protein